MGIKSQPSSSNSKTLPPPISRFRPARLGVCLAVGRWECLGAWDLELGTYEKCPDDQHRPLTWPRVQCSIGGSRSGGCDDPHLGRTRCALAAARRAAGLARRVQPVERGSLWMRVHRAPELLGARGHGPVHASPRRSRSCTAVPVKSADLCRMFNAAIHGRGTPRHLRTHHDRLFDAHRWTANLRIFEIDENQDRASCALCHTHSWNA